ALKVLEKALQLDQGNTRVRAAYAEFAKLAQIAAQQGKFRDLLANAQQELSSRHFTAAIEILREAEKIDAASSDLQRLLSAAVTGQEQERRRKLIEQVHAQVENCLLADEFDRATELINRAIEQLPAEASLVQLKKRVDSESRNFRVKQLVEITVRKAQEAFATSPHEALGIAQRALQELPGEERLLALEDTLRQRLKGLQAEEVRARYLREAQEAIDHSEFEKAIGILESYQVELGDSAGVSELLDFARAELAQQQRRERIADCSAQARSLIEQDRIDEAIHLLEPIAAETGEAGLARLLNEARGQQAEASRRLQALVTRVKGLRDRGQLDEAIQLLESSPAANAKGSLLNAMLTELRNENARKQALRAAIDTASGALEKLDFHGGMEALQSVRRAYGDSEEISHVIADYEARRTVIANEHVGKSVETARAAMLANDVPAALKELQATAELVEFADQAQQADWRRLRTEAGKPPTRRATGSVGVVGELAAKGEIRTRSKLPIIAIAGGGVAVIVVLVIVFLMIGKNHNTKETNPSPPPPPVSAIGTLKVRGNLADVDVFVDGTLKGFTQSDGTLALPLDAGSHTVRFTKAGYDDLQPPAVTISANNELNLPFTLKLDTGPVIAAPETYLTLHSTPGALVTIDKVPAGKTDGQGNLIAAVKPGKRSVQISLENYQPYNATVKVDPGEKRPVNALLTPITKSSTPSFMPQPSSPANAPAPPPPSPVQIVSFTPSASHIEAEQSTTLQWVTTNAKEVTIDNGVGTQPPNGQFAVSPKADTVYTLTARGDGGVAQSRVSVYVAAKATPSQPAVTSTGPIVPSVDNKALLRKVVNDFQGALNSHDTGKIKTVWLGMDAGQAKSLQGLFRSNPEATMKEQCPDSTLSIEGDRAQWACTEIMTIKSSGKMQDYPRKQTLTFTKKGENWYLANKN
ncbi:MAG: PEGA domain-containing protein, partial [Deltaproteobacteria bacterium]|nr:PEGA domain-containing protein [Deltaproteobacteria bacterium]